MNANRDQTSVKGRYSVEENSLESINEGEENTDSSDFVTLNVSSCLSNTSHQHVGNYDRTESLGIPPVVTNCRTEPPAPDDDYYPYQRIRDLEKLVQEQNRKILRHEETERNYVTALERLARKETENAVVLESREKFYHENKFLQEQLDDRTRECEKLQQRICDLNTSLCMALNDARESEEKIQELEQQLLKVKTHTSEQPTDQSRELIIRGDLHSCTVHEGVQVDSGIGVHLHDTLHELPSKRRRHEFSTTPTILPRCRNCNTVFDKLKPHEISCSFHRAAPQPLKTWKPQLENTDRKFHTADILDYKFWPCCEKAGLKEPPGCLRLKNHDIIYPGEE